MKSDLFVGNEEESTNGQKRRLEKALQILGPILLRAFIRDGIVDPDSQTNEEIRIFLINAIKEIIEGEADLGISLDWRDSLLDWANRMVLEDEYRIPIILYATWIEHTLNDVIHAYALRRSIDSDLVVRMLRETNVRAKTTWILELFDLPPFESEYLKSIQKIFDLRNLYIHYKWKSKDQYRMPTEENEIKEISEEAQDVIEYLQAYIHKNMYGGNEDNFNIIFGLSNFD